MIPVIHSTVVPVGPRKPRLAEQCFALLLSTSLDAPPPADADKDLIDSRLLPWLWSDESATRGFRWAGGVVVRLWSGGVLVPHTLSFLDDDRAPRAVSLDRARRLVKRPVSDHYALVEVQGQVKGMEPLARRLGALATSFGGLSQALRLIRYFRITPTHDALEDAKLVAGPEFGMALDDAMPTPDPDTPGLFVDWAYREGADVRARLRSCALEIAMRAGLICFDGEPMDQADSGLDFGSLWLRPRAVAAPPPPTAAEGVLEDDSEAGALPHPLAVQLLPTADAAPERAWERVSGVCLLTRRTSSGEPWRCMNGARVVDAGAADLLDGVALAPLPLLERGVGELVRDRGLEYQQRPLLAELDSPDSLEASDVALTQVDGVEQLAETPTPKQRESRLVPIRRGDDARFSLERLVFGETYDVAAFLVDIAGGLPDALSDGVPWALRAGGLLEGVPGGGAPGAIQIRYARRVGIGHIEIAHCSADGRPAPWPTTPGVHPLSAEVLDDSERGPRAPLVLKEGETFDFALRPPAVAPEVAERWAKTEPMLRDVLTQWLAHGVQALDDPAVSGCLLELEELDPATQQWTLRASQHMTFQRVRGRSEWRTLRLEQGAAWSVDGRIRVPKADAAPRIARLKAYVTLEEGAADRFEAGYLSVEQRGTHEVLAPECFIIELATPAVAHALLEQAVSARPLARQVTIDVHPRTAAEGVALSVFHRFTVDRQAWYYDGLPRPALDGLEWRAAAFAKAREQDALALPVKATSPRKLLRGDPITIAIDPFDQDLNSWYLRYRVRGISRYAALYADDAPPSPRWLPTELEYAGPAPARPLIRALVPLTQSDQDDTAASPVLALIDQVPFAGGVTEELQCRLFGETDPEAGPDPIVSGARRPASFGPISVDGPYGHTRDTDALRATYLRGSYVLRAPEGMPPWGMAKIQCRRVHRAPWQTLVKESGWTDPQWVQFLPRRGFNGARGQHLSEASLTIDVPKKELTTEVGSPFRLAALITSDVFDCRGRPSEAFEAFILLDPPSMSGEIARFEVRHRPMRGSIGVRLCELQVVPGQTLAGWTIQQLIPDDGTEPPCRITRISDPIAIATAP